MNKHTTNNYVVFRDTIQRWIDNGKLKLPEKPQMIVDADHFPPATVSMVDAHLPRDKKKGKAEFIPTQYAPKQNPQPWLKVDLSQNEPPKFFSNPAYAESMSDSNIEENEGPMVLCSRCQSTVIITKPKAPQLQAEATQSAPIAGVTSQTMLSVGQHQRVFDRLRLQT